MSFGAYRFKFGQRRKQAYRLFRKIHSLRDHLTFE